MHFFKSDVLEDNRKPTTKITAMRKLVAGMTTSTTRLDSGRLLPMDSSSFDDSSDKEDHGV